MTLMRAIIVAAFASVALAIPVSAQEKATLYSPLEYKQDQRRAFFDFQLGEIAKPRARWDLAYGLLRAGDEFDWFQSSSALGNRSVIRDLGELKWADQFDVPVIEPLPKLKPGEQRQITVDVSGADGADGAPGADGADAVPGADADGIVRQGLRIDDPRRLSTNARPKRDSKPKHDGKPKIDPLFVKAIVGHVYAIHVVNDTQDFYALFRVEALTRGDNCTISWRLVPAPVAETVRKQK